MPRLRRRTSPPSKLLLDTRCPALGSWYLTPFLVNQTNHFINLGYGWLCKHCSAENAEHHAKPDGRAAHERKTTTPRMPSLPLARWTDATRHSLTCPRCGIEETINKE